ncbi:hypothetical protein QE152_g26387 [Popillia japonica]|uniref:Uncharacterized protein n=1 Tax=Popillia japonica TaxID=7064 RepID=A0AAW1JWY0_POPJA
MFAATRREETEMVDEKMDGKGKRWWRRWMGKERDGGERADVLIFWRNSQNSIDLPKDMSSTSMAAMKKLGFACSNWCFDKTSKTVQYHITLVWRPSHLKHQI